MAELSLLESGARRLGIELTVEQISAFSLYMRELLLWNQRANLTAVVDPAEIQVKHFLDSLTCLLAFPGIDGGRDPQEPAEGLAARLKGGEGLSCVDVGSGAGFPGLPLKICLPGMSLTLVESIGKKTAFLSHVVRLLRLQNTRVMTTRAEDLARVPGEREGYDVVVARAVSRLAVLAELCLPLCRVGGRVIAPKKGEIQEEMEEGRYAVEVLGGRYGPTVPVRLPSLGDDRFLVVMEKVAPTPHIYPRRAGMPAKRPLVAPSVSHG